MIDKTQRRLVSCKLVFFSLRMDYIRGGQIVCDLKISILQVKVTRQHNEECKTVLKLMGIPYLDVSVC